MAKAFDAVYDTVDPETGDPLEWEWDNELRVFTATDRSLRVYTITPIYANMDVDDGDVDTEDDDSESDGED